MSVPLTLGLPPRPVEHPLLAGLLDDGSGHGRSGLVHGVPVRPATDQRRDDGPVALVLDGDDPAADRTGVARREVWRPRTDLAALLDLGADLALVVGVAPGPALADDVARVVARGHAVGLPAGLDPAALADALAVLAHADRPAHARAADAAEVLGLLAATAAALRGSDVRAARREPDVAGLRRLPDAAGAAVREVLASVVVEDPAAVAAELAAAGLGPG